MAMVDQSLPKENFRDWLNEFRQDLKFRYVPFRGYYKLRAYKYMLWKNPEMRLLQFLTDPRKDSLDIEGHEKAALLGARRTIARERPNLFIENELVHAGSEVSEVFTLLHDMDYDGFAVIDGVLTNLRHFSFEERQTKCRAIRSPMTVLKPRLIPGRISRNATSQRLGADAIYPP